MREAPNTAAVTDLRSLSLRLVRLDQFAKAYEGFLDDQDEHTLSKSRLLPILYTVSRYTIDRYEMGVKPNRNLAWSYIDSD